MQPVEIALRLLAGVALILANGFFVAIEFALTRARQFTESEFVGDGNPALERAWEMTGDLLDGVDLEAVAAPPMTMSADTSVSDAIDRFQAESQELAVVLAEGEVRGLLPVTDTLEAVVGDIRDPMDEQAGVA